MRALHVFEAAVNTPWAITEGALQTILEIAAGEMVDLENVARWKGQGSEAVEAQLGQPLDDTRTVTVRDGVATIPVQGPIVRYADFFSEMSGATSIDTLARDFSRALSDPTVHAIVLLVDSPGGAVNGVNEFSEMVYQARETKPIVAYVAHMGASAAYWIASACSEIVCDATASLGSIGVVMALRDPSKQSVRDLEFVSSQSPNKRPNVATERGRAQIQSQVDSLATVFVETVARNRGVSSETVLSEFGQGGVLIGREAVQAGLADRLGSYESVVAELKDQKPGSMPGMRPLGAAHTQEGPAMGFWDGFFRAAKAEGIITAEDLAPQPAAIAPVSVTAELVVSEPNAEQVAQVAKLQADVAALQQEKAQMEQVARTSRFQALIAGGKDAPAWIGDAAQHLAVLTALADSQGEDGTAFTAYVAQQRAVATQIRSGKLFEEIGSDAPGGGASAWERITAKAQALAASEQITFEQAVARVAQQDSALYAAYQAEQRAR